MLLFALLTAFNPPPQAGPVHSRPKSQARPALSGSVQTDATAHFVIHYTLIGEDAVDPTDENGDGLPDYVGAVGEALEFTWQQTIEQQGWQLPLPDKGEGGDNRFDVYLENQADLNGNSDLFGYMETFGGFVGDNPATPILETGTAYGYLSLDNDYDQSKFGFDLAPLEAMQTTAAHELHHAIQAAYDDEDPYQWLYEATSSWLEAEIYPQLHGADSYQLDYLAAPDICPLSVGRDDQDVRWYGGWILLRYISEHYGGPSTIRRLWEQMISQDGMAALERILVGQNTTLAEVLVDFSVANLTRSNCPDNSPYCYAHGQDYVRPYVEEIVRIDPTGRQTLIPKDGVQQFGADYIRLRSTAPVQIAFQGSSAGQWHLRLVGFEPEGGIQVFPAFPPELITVDPSQFEKLYLVIVNTAPVAAEAECGYHNYTLAFAGTAASGAIKAPLVPPDPGPYLPATFGGDNSSFLGAGEPVTADELLFSPSYPGYIPAGYQFDQLVRYTATDQKETAGVDVPSGESTIALNYTGSSPGAYFSIIQTPTPYQTILAWVEDQDYIVNEVRLVNDVPVYLVEQGSESGPFSRAAFIHADLFIVIEGTLDRLVMQQLVAGFPASTPSDSP